MAVIYLKKSFKTNEEEGVTILLDIKHFFIDSIKL